MIVVCACRKNEKFAKYWENFSNVNYILHVAIVLDPRYKMKYVHMLLLFLSKYMKQVKLSQKLSWLNQLSIDCMNGIIIFIQVNLGMK